MISPDEFQKLLGASRRALITTHLRPDADATGSVLGLKHYLDQNYPSLLSEIWITGNGTASWSFVDPLNQINWTADIATKLGDFDLVIFLDGNVLNRFSYQTDKIELSQFQSICIDHHLGVADPFTLVISDPTVTSTCELIYQLCYQDKAEQLSAAAAKALLVGIMGDTGTFRYLSPATSKVLTIAEQLIAISQTDLQLLDLELNQLGQKELRLIGSLIANTEFVTLPGIPKLSYTYLPLATLAEYNEYEVKSAVSRYLEYFLRRVDKAKWGFVVSPRRSGYFSINFRSTPGEPPVQKLAEQFGGGGHLLAAGGEYQLEPGESSDAPEICTRVLTAIQNLSVISA